MSTLTLPPAATGRREDAKVMGLIGLAHSISHFSQLLLAPLFPWLKVEFAVSYAELGFLLTIFFVVSCAVQAMSGFWVDRYGPRPVLFGGLLLVGTAALGYASSTSYTMLALFSVVAGIGNGVFHPVDYTVLNRKINKTRLGHAYSVHGITGSLGWALAPALLVPLTLAYSWRVALLCAAGLVFLVLLVLWLKREEIAVPPAATLPSGAAGAAAGLAESSFAFLKIPAVWMCFGFFFFFAGALSIVQSFGPQAAKELHGVPAHLAAICLTVYMVCSAGGMLLGGFLAADPEHCDRVVGISLATAASHCAGAGFCQPAGLDGAGALWCHGPGGGGGLALARHAGQACHASQRHRARVRRGVRRLGCRPGRGAAFHRRADGPGCLSRCAAGVGRTADGAHLQRLPRQRGTA